MYFESLCIACIFCLHGVSTDNTTDYIHQLELKISDLESHTLASEQKQGAVLSSILSRIQSLEQIMHSQDQMMQSQDQMIQSQKQTMESQNKMIQSQEKKIQSQDQKIQSQESTTKELKAEFENVTKTDCSLASSSGFPPVVFEASTSHDMNGTSRIHFDQIITNVGGAFSLNTDVFTAPRNGTYQIWFNVNLDLYFSGGQGPVLRVAVGAGQTVYSSYMAPDEAPKYRHHHYKELQGVLAVSLLQGDPVYLTLSPSDMVPYTKVKSESTFGGVFLGDM